MKKLIAPFALMLLAVGLAVADVPRPDKPKNDPARKPVTVDTTLSIELNREAKEAKLIIPRSQLKQLRAELESLDNGDTAAASLGSGGLQTIAAGVLLSLAFVFGGFWFIRPRATSLYSSKAAAVGAIVFSGLALASVVFGNAGPPPEARSITSKMFSQAVHLYGFGSGKIKLEVSDEARNPTLIVPSPAETDKKSEE